MKFIVSLLALTIGFVPVDNVKEFVCLPCGQDCDDRVYTSEGSCVSCGMRLVEKTTVRFSNISPDQLCLQASTKDVVILDVRSREEFDGTATGMPTFGHFKNAINIDVNELENRVQELDQYAAKEILVYCSHAHRSATATYFLTTHGFSKARNMTGGVSVIDPRKNECFRKSFVIHNR